MKPNIIQCTANLGEFLVNDDVNRLKKWRMTRMLFWKRGLKWGRTLLLVIFVFSVGISTVSFTTKFYSFDDVEENIKNQIKRIKSTPFLSNIISVHGFIYDIKTGMLREVLA